MVPGDLKIYMFYLFVRYRFQINWFLWLYLILYFIALVLKYQSEALKKARKNQRRKQVNSENAPTTNSGSEITAVLETMGLRKYAEAFVREEIAVDMLPLLTEEHLKQLGVNTIGARLQFKSYVRALALGNEDLKLQRTNGMTNASHLTSANLATLTVEVQSLRNAVRSLCDAIRGLSDCPLLSDVNVKDTSK